MFPPRSTRRTRLSGQPDFLQFLVAPGGMPVPDISVRSPTRSASLVPTIALAEVSPGPWPNCQTMLPPGSISITRLLNWSVMRMLPGALNSLPARAFGAAAASRQSPTRSAIPKPRPLLPGCFDPRICTGSMSSSLVQGWSRALVPKQALGGDSSRCSGRARASAAGCPPPALDAAPLEESFSLSAWAARAR